MIIIGFGTLFAIVILFFVFKAMVKTGQKAADAYSDATEDALTKEFRKDISQRHW